MVVCGWRGRQWSGATRVGLRMQVWADQGGEGAAPGPRATGLILIKNQIKYGFVGN
jgi:hypothetical protein